MRRVAIEEPKHIRPFNEPARRLTLQGRPLWLHHRELFARYINSEIEFPTWELAYQIEGANPTETILHRDNLYFNESFLEEFVERARAGGAPVQLAFSASDPAIVAHVLPLSTQLVEYYDEENKEDLLLAEMWYLPEGIHQIEEHYPKRINR